MRLRRIAHSPVLVAGVAGSFAASGWVSSPPVQAASYANIQVSHDHYTAHVEPSIAANPRNARNLVVVALLLGRSGGPRIGTFASFDAGRTWRDNGPLALPPNTNVSDVPAVAFGARGRVLVTGMAENTGEMDLGSDEHTCVCLWQSTNGGLSFHRPLVIERGQAVDHPSVATSGSGSAVYVVWRSKLPDGIAFSCSLDRGHRFSRPRLIATVPGSGTFAPAVAAGENGKLDVVYDVERRPAGNGKRNALSVSAGVAHIEIITSTDGGSHFSSPRRLARAPESVAPAKKARVLSLPAIATNPIGQAIYVSYMSGTALATGITLSRSLDGGRTWHSSTLTPSRVGAASYFQPAVAADGGNVDVSYLSFRKGYIDLWMARSSDQGGAFASPLRVTTRSFNPAQGPRWGGAGGAWWIGDYQGIAAAGAIVHPVWGDTRSGHLEVFTAAVPGR